jgi:RND family efflux transporter MFP subunit
VVTRRIAFLLALAGIGCHGQAAVAPPPPPAVVTMTAHAEDMPLLTRRGSVTTGSRVRLGFNAAGVLSSMKVKAGDSVKEGQVLARLKDGGASAQLAAAQASRKRALRDLGTASSLAKNGSVPELEKEDARTAADVANANASLAATYVSDRRLTAPISGTVVQRLAEPGEAVGPGKPVLVLDETGRIVVKLGVTEREVGLLKAGQPVVLAVDGGGAPLAAKVTSIGPAPLDDGLYAIEVTPADPHAPGLRPGALVTATFQPIVQQRTVKLPLDAIVRRDGKSFVYVVAKNVVASRELAIAREDGRDVYVAAGLADGEHLVREAAEFLHDGQAVRALD